MNFFRNTVEKTSQAMTKFGNTVESKVSSAIDKLPFPLNPAEFWATGLKILYGPSHLLLGVGTSNMTYPDGRPLDVGPILSGINFRVGVGLCKPSGFVPSIQVKLDMVDLKMLNWDGGVCLEYDTAKPSADCTIMTLDPDKVFDKFVEFGNPLNWTRLTQECVNDPITFFQREIAIFYPAGINLNLNLKGTIGKMGGGIVGMMGGHRLHNQEPIWICCVNAPTFPPRNFKLTPRNPIVLVDDKNDEPVAIITAVETIWIHPAVEPTSEVEICQAASHGPLAFDFVRDMVHHHLNPPKWP